MCASVFTKYTYGPTVGKCTSYSAAHSIKDAAWFKIKTKKDLPICECRLIVCAACGTNQ